MNVKFSNPDARVIYTSYSLKASVSRGDAIAASPIKMNAAQATQRGADVLVSAKVAIKGALRDDSLPMAMRKPVPSPRFSTLRARGVYLYRGQHKNMVYLSRSAGPVD